MFLPVMLGLHYWFGWDWILVLLGSLYTFSIIVFILGIIVILKTRETVDLSFNRIKNGSVLWIISFVYYIYIGAYILVALLLAALVGLLGFYIVNANNK